MNSTTIKIILAAVIIIFGVRVAAKKLRTNDIDKVSQLESMGKNISLAPEPRAAPAPAAAPAAPQAAESKPAPTPAAPAAPVKASPDMIVGKVTLSGKAPAEKPPKKAPADCHVGEITTKDYYVAADGGLGNVLVYVKDGLAGKTFPVSTEKPVFDQVGCMYTPQVLGVQAGQTFIVQNGDDTMHNVNCQAKKNEPFNLSQAKKGDRSEKVFKNPELFVKFKCDVHPWMSGYVGVIPHPFFAVTQADGSFQIKGLPAGEYTVVAAHPKAGESQSVKVSAGGTADLSITAK
jgi:plastocyanin